MSWFKKPRGKSDHAKELPGAFARTYGVELLYEDPPVLSLRPLLEAVRAYQPTVQPLDHSGKEGGLHLVHPDHPVQFTDGAIPAQTCVIPSDQAFRLTETQEVSLTQSWSFPEAREVVERCRHIVLLTDLMSSPLDHQVRLKLFQDVLAGALTIAPAQAIHWRPTGQFVDPRVYLDAHREGGSSRFFAGSLNVRFYNISNSPGDMLMDTLGLAALGLPDLQCHYRNLDPGRVAATIANTAYYLFDQGDVITDGHTVEGIDPGSRWHCQHEDAMLPPARVVLDLNPGSPHAAGGRS